jgi:hypothetical protein
MTFHLGPIFRSSNGRLKPLPDPDGRRVAVSKAKQLQLYSGYVTAVASG